MTPLLEAVLSKVSQSESVRARPISPDESQIAFVDFVKPAGRSDVRGASQHDVATCRETPL
jgi:hypothetical protein